MTSLRSTSTARVKENLDPNSIHFKLPSRSRAQFKRNFSPININEETQLFGSPTKDLMKKEAFTIPSVGTPTQADLINAYKEMLQKNPNLNYSLSPTLDRTFDIQRQNERQFISQSFVSNSNLSVQSRHETLSPGTMPEISSHISHNSKLDNFEINFPGMQTEHYSPPSHSSLIQPENHQEQQIKRPIKSSLNVKSSLSNSIHQMKKMNKDFDKPSFFPDINTENILQDVSNVPQLINQNQDFDPKVSNAWHNQNSSFSIRNDHIGEQINTDYMIADLANYVEAQHPKSSFRPFFKYIILSPHFSEFIKNIKLKISEIEKEDIHLNHKQDLATTYFTYKSQEEFLQMLVHEIKQIKNSLLIKPIASHLSQLISEANTSKPVTENEARSFLDKFKEDFQRTTVFGSRLSGDKNEESYQEKYLSLFNILSYYVREKKNDYASVMLKGKRLQIEVKNSDEVNCKIAQEMRKTKINKEIIEIMKICPHVLYDGELCSFVISFPEFRFAVSVRQGMAYPWEKVNVEAVRTDYPNEFSKIIENMIQSASKTVPFCSHPWFVFAQKLSSPEFHSFLIESFQK